MNTEFKEFMIMMLRRGMVIVYILMMTLSFAAENIGLPWNFSYVMWLGVFCMAIAWLMITGDFTNVRKLTKWILIIGGNFIIMVFFSILVWTINLESFDHMTRATTRVRYQFFGVMGAAASVYLFNLKAIDYTFYAMVIANGTILIRVIREFGFGTFISGFIELFATKFEVDIPVMRALELHDITFAFGLFFMYYLLRHKEVSHPIIKMALAVFFWFLGFKRIAVLGVAAALMLVPVLYLLKPNGKKYLLYTVAVGGIVICYAWVIAIYTGIFDQVAEMIGVNTMGRTNLWGYMKPYYNLSPSFMGHGMGFVSDSLAAWSAEGRFTREYGALHNDILSNYIDLGFFGFMIWLVWELLVKLHLCLKDFDLDTGILFTLLTLANWVSFFTDNTYTYAATNMGLRLLVLAFAFRDKGGELTQ